MDLFKIQTVDQLEQFIKDGNDILEFDENGKTPLFYPHVIDNEELFKKMVEYGVDINRLSDYSELVLHYATEPKHLKLMIECDADLNFDPDGRPPVFYFTKNKECLSFLLENGVNINQKSLSGENLLMQEDLDDDIVDLLISKGIDINAKNEEGENILFVSDSLYAIQKAIEKGVDVNSLNKEGYNALYRQLSTNNLDIILELVKNGININKLDQEYFSVFASNNITNEESLLGGFLEYGWDMNEKSKASGLPISYEVMLSSLAGVKFLVEKGLDITIENDMGVNIYRYCDSKEKLDFLVEQNIPPKIFSSHSPIMQKHIQNYIDILQEKNVLKDILLPTDSSQLNKKIRL